MTISNISHHAPFNAILSHSPQYPVYDLLNSLKRIFRNPETLLRNKVQSFISCRSRKSFKDQASNFNNILLIKNNMEKTFAEQTILDSSISWDDKYIIYTHSKKLLPIEERLRLGKLLFDQKPIQTISVTNWNNRHTLYTSYKNLLRNEERALVEKLLFAEKPTNTTSQISSNSSATTKQSNVIQIRDRRSSPNHKRVTN
jgi:hypothetical protein